MEVDADTDDMLARLIDSHLSHIYPVYWARTRAILIQQARERLVCGFDGCLLRFEQGFLCKFAQIAAALRSAHQIGEVSFGPEPSREIRPKDISFTSGSEISRNLSWLSHSEDWQCQ